MQNPVNYVGIDISKLSFDAALKDGTSYPHHRFDNNQAGFSDFLKVLPSDSIAVMEASGPYYLRLACFLAEKSIGVSVINPLVIRRFCQMRMSGTKTDKKDAKMIAEMDKQKSQRTGSHQRSMR